VAMTRAAERLIVAGFHGPRKAKDCWYDMARAGLDGAMAAAQAPWSAKENIWRLGEPWRAAARGAASDIIKRQEGAPAWLRTRARREQAQAPLNPSRAVAAPSKTEGGGARASRLEAGRLSHSLLQYLPDIAAAQRREAARRFLARNGADAPLEERSAIAERVLTIIADPRLGALFGANSRAEVAIAASLPRPGRPPTPFAGRIDRLAIDEEGVLIADFKSGAARGPTPPQYLAQLALYRAALAPLYPGRALRAFLVWLDNPDIVEIDPGALDAALAKLLGLI
jgi:ATP-dependent helicase/nuclease subunit A